MEDKDGGRWIDPIIRVLKYHQSISERVEYLQEISGLLGKEKFHDKIRQIENFFGENMLIHFSIEEEVIFPVLDRYFKSHGRKRLVPELREEHRELVDMVKSLDGHISEIVYPLEKKDMAKMNSLIKKIASTLLEHISKEDRDLYPVLQKEKHLFND